MNLSELDKKLQSEFAIKKSIADNLAKENLIKAHSNPIFSQLETLERETIFELGKEQFNSKNNKQSEKNIKELKNSLSNIQKYKNEILNSMGLSMQDLTPKYSCLKCNDTGFIAGNFCECYKKQRNSEIIKEYGLEDKNLYGFDNINQSLFNKDELNEFLKLKNILEKWCNSYPNVKKHSIVLTGKTGVGKTFLAKCIVKNLLEKDLSVCYVTAFEMNNLMLKYHTTFDNQKYQHIVPLIESDILVIDDLGSEPLINNVTLNYLFNVLSEREEKNLATIITTNLSTSDILDRYKERICSRLSNKQTGVIFNIDGSDLRTKK